MDIKTFARFTRIEHSIFLVLAVVVGEAIVTESLPLLQTILSAVSVFFIGIGSFAINDVLDYKTDKKNRRTDRPLVSGGISMQAAKRITWLSFIIGLFFSMFITPACTAIAVIFSLVAIAYSYFLKKVMLAGNIFVAFSMAVSFIFGNYIVSSEINSAVLLLAAMAFLTGIGREVIKSIQDMVGDKKYGRRTLPIVVGKKTSKYFAALCILAAVLVSPAPFLVLPKFQYDFFYLVPVAITDILLIKSMAYSLRLKKLEKVRKMTLLALGIGLIGFLLGALL